MADSTHKSYYITTPIYYLSGTPHIGTAYTSIICDALARFKRLDGYNVKYLSGTDEHGLKVFQCAEKAGMDIQAYCDAEVEKFKAFTPLLNLSNDDFIRTTEDRHKRAATAFWQAMEENGWIYKDSYSGWYAVSDEAYYTEEECYICPDTKKRKATASGNEVVWMEEDSYFFKMSAFQDKLLTHYEQNPDAIQPASRRNEVLSFIKSGLRDISISRSKLSWGIPVPNDDKHVMYVWTDALVNYLTGLGYPDQTPEMENLWPSAVHIVGKDILRFHAVYWPTMLMAAGLPLPKTVFAHGWLMAGDGRKMSKSLGNAIIPTDIIERYGLDQLRYYLMRDVVFGNDGNISAEALVHRTNSDLANDLGNLAQRVLSMVAKNCDGKIPTPEGFEPEDQALLQQADALLNTVRGHMDDLAPHKALEEIWVVVRAANAYIDHMAPWALRKTNLGRMETVLMTLCEVIRRIGLCTHAFMPQSSDKILDQLAITPDDRSFAAWNKALVAETTLPKPEGIFPRFVAKEAA